MEISPTSCKITQKDRNEAQDYKFTTANVQKWIGKSSCIICQIISVYHSICVIIVS